MIKGPGLGLLAWEPWPGGPGLGALAWPGLGALIWGPWSGCPGLGALAWGPWFGCPKRIERQTDRQTYRVRQTETENDRDKSYE